MLRPTLRFAGLCAGLMICANALALSLSDLSQQDATGGLKDALTQGAQLAGKLGKVAKKMKQFGMGDQVDQLETSMNKAAEAAVTQAQPILVDAVKKMTVEDAKGILSGGQDSATQYLSKTSREQIRTKFLPIVKQATDQVGLAQQYNAFAGQAATLGVLDAKNANIESYVTEQALNGLFEMIGKQEETIRKNPAAAATSLAKKVFGTL
jgi:cell division septum initiation protein DivIVA